MTGQFPQGAASAYQYPLLIKQLWHTPLEQFSDQVIVYRDVKRLTYREVHERVSRLASSLAGVGVNPGDTVGILDWDSNRFLEAYFAVPMMGAVLQTVNVRLPPESLAYTINHGRASVLLVNDDFVPLLESIRHKLPNVKTLVVISDRGSPATGGLDFVGEYERLLAAAAPDYDFRDFDENTLATTFYTSGTTGRPKGVYFTHRQLVLHTLAQMAFSGVAAKQGRLSRDDVYMPITPMFHSHAWGFPWTATLAGLKQVYPGRYEPALLLKLIRDEGVTFTHGVPTILQMLLEAAHATGTDLKGLKMAVGGSELPKGLAEQALAMGVDVYSGYGLSESAPLLTSVQVKSASLAEDPEKQAKLRTAAGIAAPLVDLRVVGANMEDVAHDGRTPGEIVVRAPWLTQGYVDNAEASEQLWAGGYLHSGDIGVMEPDGTLRVVDRIKDVIKSGGEWISSLQIEDAISESDGVSEVAVIGVDDPKWGERPMALVVQKHDCDLTAMESDIRARLNALAAAGVIPKFGVPDKIAFVDQLPRTSVGKFDKKLLKATYDR